MVGIFSENVVFSIRGYDQTIPSNNLVVVVTVVVVVVFIAAIF